MCTGKHSQNIIALNELKIYLGQITKYYLANAPTIRLSTSEENNLWHCFKFLTKTFMHDKKFVRLIKVPSLDATLASELYQAHSLLIIILVQTCYLETERFFFSKNALRYALPSETYCTKCIMTSNHFCTQSTPHDHSNTHILCVLALCRHSSIDQYYRVTLSPYTSLQAVYLVQIKWVILSRKPDLFTITCPEGKMRQNHK